MRSFLGTLSLVFYALGMLVWWEAPTVSQEIVGVILLVNGSVLLGAAGVIDSLPKQQKERA